MEFLSFSHIGRKVERDSTTMDLSPAYKEDFTFVYHGRRFLIDSPSKEKWLDTKFSESETETTEKPSGNNRR